MHTYDKDSEGSDVISPGNFNSEWDKFVLLMWKNVRVMWSNRQQYIMTILMPILFCSLLLILRIKLSIKYNPVEKYPNVELNVYWEKLMNVIDERKAKINDSRSISNPFIPEKIVGFAPNVLAYANIMKGASDSLQSLVVDSYNTCDQLRSAIGEGNLFAGVCFKSHLDAKINVSTHHMIKGIYPNLLKYHLIFPFGCRIYNDTFIGISWSANTMYHFYNRTVQRNIGQPDGGYVGYIREGFAPLQNAIAMSFLKIVADLENPDFKIPKVLMNRYPSKEFHRDELKESVDYAISLMIVLGNLYPVLMFVTKIVEEKESIVKSYTKLMSISNYVHCLAWMGTYFLRALFSSFVIVVLLKLKWSADFAILENSNFLAALMVISVYNITCISFALMIAAFFTQTIFAVYGTALFWILTYMPFIMSFNMGIGFTSNYALFLVIFHNTTFGFLMDAVLDLEIYGEGLNFTNSLATSVLNSPYSPAALIIIMLMQSILYICFSLYVEEIRPGNIGFSKRWNFLFTFKTTNEVEEQTRATTDSISGGSGGSMGSGSRPAPHIFEVGGRGNKVLVHMKNVRKEFGNEFSLKNINLQLFDSEITIILGHNGSGKTTLLRMMCGLSSIPSGSIKIEGFDMTNDTRYACASLGIGMGKSLLYPDLTVEDQIRYFSYIKGFRGEPAEIELEHYLKATKLIALRLEKTKFLTLGGLQKLAICCALVGQSRVVLLDEPTTYMDFHTRTLIWKLLENQKFERTILITATSATVLGGLGDRVAMLSNGQLQCEGSPVFIKKMYGQGYRLIITRGPQCEINDVTQKVQEYIPHITPLSTLGNEINYDLHEDNSEIFARLTDSLERNLTALGITSVKLRPINIDDIFFKVASANPSGENRVRLMEILNGQSSYPEENKYLHFMEIKERVTGIRKFMQQFSSMWHQRIMFGLQYRLYFISRLIFLPIFVIIAFAISIFNINLLSEPVIHFTLEQYKSSVTVVEGRYTTSNTSSHILDHYKELIFWLGIQHKIDDTEGVLLSDYFLKKANEHVGRLDQDHHVGATIANDYIIAWFNNVALHSVPLSLNLVHNAIFRTIYNHYGGIDVSLEPLNNMRNYVDSQVRTPINTSQVLPVCLSLGVCCIWNTIAFIFVRELQSGYDKIQMVVGAKFLTYWLSNIAYDSLIILLMSILITLAIMVCQVQLQIAWTIYLWYMLVFMLCGWAVYAFNYMIALFFVCPSHAYTFSVSVQAFGVICFCHIVAAFEKYYLTTAKSPYVTYLMIWPLFSFCSAVSAIYYIGDYERICRDEHIRFISVHLENCNVIPNCCHSFKLFRFDDGILLELTIMGGAIAFCWCVILMVRYKYICNCFPIPKDNYNAQLKDHKRRHDDKNERFGQFASFQEEHEIHKMTNSQLRKIPLICDRLGKNIDGRPIIDRVSLISDSSTCFGLLCMSGSGVTTFFNLIAGLKSYSYGRILIQGRSTIYNKDLIQKMLGYGRQEMIRFPEFTVRHMMEHACRLRCYPLQHINDICENLAKVIGIYPFYHKNLSVLSLGVLHRLTCAIAVMGNPKIILFDMALTGIDSAGKREVWNILNRMKDKGSAILVATTSFSDCQRNCTRVGFMTNGRISRLSDPRHLYNVVSDSHILKVKLSGRMTGGPVSHKYIYVANVNKLTNFIQTEFPDSILKEHHGYYFLFVISARSHSISKIFTAMMRNANNLNIEDFELTQSFLSQPFIDFWEKEIDQIEEEQYKRNSATFP